MFWKIFTFLVHVSLSVAQNYAGNTAMSLSDIVDMSTFKQVSQSTEAIFHEGPVFVETTNELYFSSNRFTDSSGGQNIRISKLNVTTPNATPVTVTTNPPILMANGGARINLKEIVYCSQGYNSTPGSLMRLNIETLVATKIPLQIVRPFGTADPNPDFSSPNDVVLSDQYDGYFFTDPPYGYYQNFRPENTMPPAVYFADRRSLNVTRIWFFPSNYRPNGLSPSADGSRLYVANSGFQIGNGSTDPTVPIVMHVFAMSKGSKGVPVLTEMDPISTGTGVGVPDTVKVDEKGNIYVTVSNGVRVYTPGGVYIDTIVIPSAGPVANIAWAGKTLYILAETFLYSVQAKNGAAPLHDINNTNW
ncbi:uncharacterized protein LOC129600247 [Paramacrobiotus metropolitanus]|uniref:uncharacterized protein LOC129600247 n=1 Tax=Paramacrobiotus metropolitanus TaxID=2943436 RepID=UPI002445DB5F|nr:uncharacterized protein LOC129600247 [Paramacrobiotus metropolitanus]